MNRDEQTKLPPAATGEPVPTGTSPAAQPESPAPGGSGFMVFGIAILVVLAIVGFVVFGLGESSLLPMNYKGFDGKETNK